MSLRHPPSTDMLRLLFCGAMLTLLAGCGFHPRGELQLPPNLGPVTVQASDPFSPLADSLARALERAGAQSASTAAQGCGSAIPSSTNAPAQPVVGANSSALPAVAGCGATRPAVARASDTHTATLRIAGETFRAGPLSVDNLSRVREYVLTYAVDFEFTAADGSVLVPLQEVKLQRDYTYDVSRALGSAAEQGTIHDEMQRDMAASILRRIGIALRNKTP